MNEMNSKLIGEQEKTLEEFALNNKAFYEQFKKEAFLTELKREIKFKQSFGNKDKHFKKTLNDKWQDKRLL